MANELIQPDKFFLSRFGMTESALERTLGAALERKADYADLYFEYRSAEGLSLEDSIVNRTSKSIRHGVRGRVGARVRPRPDRLCLLRRGHGRPDAACGRGCPRDRAQWRRRAGCRAGW